MTPAPMTPAPLSVVTCGGTIAMTTTVDGLRRPAPNAHVAEVVSALESRTVRHIDAGSIDSSQLLPGDLTAILTAVRAASGHGPVLVTHGTDTLAWTAAMLAASLRLEVPVVITAANVPLGEDGSDAATNLAAAVVAAGVLDPGVFVVFAGRADDDAEVFAGGFLRKTRGDGRAFAARGERLGFISPDGAVTLERGAPPVGVHAERGRFDRRVAVLGCSPFLDAGTVVAVSQGMDALVVELYACGTAPAGVVAGCGAAVAAGVEVWACPPAPLDVAQYPSSHALSETGSHLRFDLSVELAALAAADGAGASPTC
jgi:L-asparaginase